MIRFFRRADLDRVSARWLREYQIRELRNQFIGPVWNWRYLIRLDKMRQWRERKQQRAA